MNKTPLELVQELAVSRQKEAEAQAAERKKQEEDKLRALITRWQPVSEIIREVLDAYPDMGKIIPPSSSHGHMLLTLRHPVNITSPSIGPANTFKFSCNSVYVLKHSSYMLYTAVSVEELIPCVISLLADAVRAYEN